MAGGACNFPMPRSLITKLDREGTEMEARLPLTGRATLQLTHEWSDSPGGARLRSTLRLGAAAGARHSPPLRARPALLRSTSA